jgi:hypothetical protein
VAAFMLLGRLTRTEIRKRSAEGRATTEGA